jgi:hypothetical protein
VFRKCFIFASLNRWLRSCRNLNADFEQGGRLYETSMENVDTFWLSGKDPDCYVAGSYSTFCIRWMGWMSKLQWMDIW